MTTGWRLPLYAVIDVEPDADAEAIQRAYRETVKEHHPDVSDHEDAQDLFVWVTRARDVLTDDTERSRYDRLGHTTFCEHEGWPSSTCSAREVARTYWGRDDRTMGSDDGTGGREGREGHHDGDPRQSAGVGGNAAGHAGHRDTEDWTPEEATRNRDDVTSPGGSSPGFGGNRSSATAGPSGRDSRAEPGRRRARKTNGAGRRRTRTTNGATGKSHPAGFSTDDLYYRNIAQVHAPHRPTGDGVGGIAWAPFVGMGVTLTFIFGAFVFVLLYVG
jgi:curved DNA-binding protein CbpA